MFVRRLFYDLDTGTVLDCYMMQGNLSRETAAERAARIGLTNYGYFEWTEPDSGIEENFAASYGRVSVDISQSPPELVFDLTPITLPDGEEPDIADMQAALETLGVEPVDDGTERV